MAGDVRQTATDAPTPPGAGSAPVPVRHESRAERARRSVYKGRFTLIYFGLAMVAGAALGTLVVLVGRGGPAPAEAWSQWAPEGSNDRRIAQIADRILHPYKLPSGRQLGAVTYSGAPSVTGPDGSTFQVRAVAVEPRRTEGDDIDTMDARGTVMYTICGLGTGCAIAEGEPTNERSQLLRRAAFELSLYTFTYVDDVDSVLVLLPPHPETEAASALFLERRDVRAQLARPLDETLVAPVTPDVGGIPQEELRVFERITRPRLFRYSYLQAQDGSPVMLLSPALV